MHSEALSHIVQQCVKLFEIFTSTIFPAYIIDINIFVQESTEKSHWFDTFLWSGASNKRAVTAISTVINRVEVITIFPFTSVLNPVVTLGIDSI